MTWCCQPADTLSVVTWCCQPADTLSVGVTASVNGWFGFGLCRQTIYLGYGRETKFCLPIQKNTDGQYDICCKCPSTQ